MFWCMFGDGGVLFFFCCDLVFYAMVERARPAHRDRGPRHIPRIAQDMHDARAGQNLYQASGVAM